jgi:7-cyano-7-deazaguanine synthase in queuosine biosynthesis
MAPPNRTNFRVCGQRDAILLRGDMVQRLQFIQDPFFDSLSRLPGNRGLDLARIAAGIYAIDRITKRDFRGNDLGTRSFAVEFEVHEPEFWRQPDICSLLTDLVEFLSGDSWHMTFEPESRATAGDGHQIRLPVDPVEADRVALFSGGLDSMAGLASRLIHGGSSYALLTVSHQASLRKNCLDAACKLQKILQADRINHSYVITWLRSGKAIRLSYQEQTQRTRAFLFCSLGAVMAQALGCHDVDLFENGVGALNSPLMSGMLFGTLATRGCNPRFLSMMSDLCSKTLDSPLRFNLPFANMTKGEVLATLQNHGLDDWLQMSHSCVHSAMRIKGVTHCGTCPACIERRQAFDVAQITDKTAYRQNIFENPPDRGPSAAYFRLYQDEASAWLAGHPRAKSRLEAHLQITGIDRSRWAKLRTLRDRHSLEVIHTYSQRQHRLFPSSSGQL